jgi:hypothetical protein
MGSVSECSEVDLLDQEGVDYSKSRLPDSCTRTCCKICGNKAVIMLPSLCSSCIDASTRTCNNNGKILLLFRGGINFVCLDHCFVRGRTIFNSCSVSATLLNDKNLVEARKQ